MEQAQNVLVQVDYEYEDGLVGSDAAQAQLPATSILEPLLLLETRLIQSRM
jgi:hypothetical protein